MSTDASLLGLDIGGSTTRAWLARGDGTVIRQATAPSASLTAASRLQVESVIGALLDELGLEMAPSPAPVAATAPAAAPAAAPAPAAAAPAAPRLDAVCIGTAGSGAAEVVGWIVERFSGIVRPPALERIVVVNDSRLALAAEGLDSGIALIAGTGSTAIGVLGESEQRAGGWGYLLGDDGGGYWVVREAVRELCRRHDVGLPAGALGETLFSGTGEDRTLDLIQRFHEEPEPARWAALAPAVLDSKDPAAEVLLLAAADALAKLVADVARLLHHPPPVPVVIAGGLVVNHTALGEATIAAIESRLGAEGDGARPAIRLSRRPPIEGALNLAKALARGLDGHSS